MKHTYQFTGMTCENCEAKVKSSLLSLPDVTIVEVSKENSTVSITMEKHISLNTLQQAIGNGKYKISAVHHNEIEEQTKSWLQTYKPILLIFTYIILISSVVVYGYGLHFNDWMNFFMALFFIAFSFFKFLDLKAFAESYSMYDIVAMQVKLYGFIYPFVELTLGISYLISFNPILTNWATIIVMGVSSIGVIQSVAKKQKIQCACLGAVFNLPMSTVTIIENLLMIIMAVAALII